jgi:Zn-dependent protease
MHFGAMLSILVVVLVSLAVHEWAHGFVALLHGDTTARDLGRLTLNPAAHVDPLGSLALPLALIAGASPLVFAWGRPAPIEHARLRNPRRDAVRVALAGPVSNLLLAIGFAAGSRVMPQGGAWGPLRAMMVAGVAWNCALAFFNLIPIPPLDGAWLLEHVLKLRHIVALHHFRLVALALVVAIVALPPSRWLFETSLHHVVGTCFGLFGLSATGTPL